MAGGLFSQARQMAGAFVQLVQTLSRLTAAELKANAGSLRTPLLMMAAGVVLAVIASALVVTAAVLALAQFVGALAACAIAAAVAALGGWALVRSGLSKLSSTSLVPRRSMATLQAQVERLSSRSHTKDIAQ